MIVFRIRTKVEGVFTSMDYFLEGKRVLLSYNGDKTCSMADDLASGAVSATNFATTSV